MSAAAALQTEIVPIDSVRPDSRNARKHNKRNIEAIKSSLLEFGQRKPIVVDDAGIVRAGNGTLQAATELGWSHIATARGAFRPEPLKKAFRGVVASAFALADNRTAELASWDRPVLADAIAKIGSRAPLIGWTDVERDALIASLRRPASIEDDDSLDELPDVVEPRTKKGAAIKLGEHELRCADCVEVMDAIAPASVDAVVTDPPYFIGFMGRQWDKPGRSLSEPFGKRATGLDWDAPGNGQAIYESHVAWAKAAFRVLKPGGHLLAFAATRTQHRLACAIEDAGFELRDTIAWCYWSGFPKSLDVSKAIDKRAGAEREKVGDAPYTTPNEKPSLPKNGKKTERMTPQITNPATTEPQSWQGWGTALKPAHEPIIMARRPFDGTVVENVLKHGVAALNIDGCRYAIGDRAWPGPQGALVGQVFSQPTQPSIPPGSRASQERRDVFVDAPDGRWPANLYACPKPSRSEREDGTAALNRSVVGSIQGGGEQAKDPVSMRFTKATTNIHPTVKPVRLMRWLCRLVTPPGALVLDPFLGSGTTMLAAELEGFRCIGVEREPSYCDIVAARVEAAIARRS